jgi:hypothetical protein
MVAIRGIYDGKVVQPLEKVDAPENSEVVITFPDHAARKAADETFWATFGSWKDDRPAEEIIKDIYASRTTSRGEIKL